MKMPPLLFTASMVLNVALVAALVFSRPSASFSKIERDTSVKTTATEKHSAATARSDGASAVPTAATDGAELDLPSLVARLRAQGLPPEVVRAVTTMMVHRQYRARRNAMRGQPSPEEYWRNPVSRSNPDDVAALRAIEREERALLRQLLGPDLDYSEESERRQFSGLPPEKVEKLKKIFADYTDLEEQLFAESGNRMAPETRAKAALLAKEKRSDIERLLTSDELLNYDLRNSPAAHRLRGRLGEFAVTEAEFRALYPAFKALTETEGGQPIRAMTPEARRAREATEKQLEAEIRRTLGEQRFAEWQEANDHGLRQTRELVATLNLPATATSEIVAVQKELQPRIVAVERDRDLTPNQRDAQLGAIAAEARARLVRVLGADGFEQYKRRGGGWLGASISRAAPIPSP